VWAVKVKGRIVTTCRSLQENAECAEAYIFTIPEFRHHGYGRQTAAAWAADVIRAGKVALYSFRKDNLPSRALARSLGLETFAEVVG
jgi:predicted GNAT family acetyltransferase